jgi:putative nucleotidyltransferase with HDIG domain
MTDPNNQLAPYKGRWVALVGKDVAGVGMTANEAKRQARHNRPRDRFTVQFVEGNEGEALVLPDLLEQLHPLLAKLDVPVYLVGGAVRDMLLGKPVHDLDFVVPKNGIRVAFQVGDWLGMPAYPLDQERDTGRVVLADGTDLDFSVFRGDSLEADLAGRDFTINAMAMPAIATRTSSLIDPLGGQADLADGIIRLAHPTALSSDPIRVLRAVRMAVKFGYTLLPDTEAEVANIAPQLANASEERVRDELVKIFDTPAPDLALGMLAKLGLLGVVMPAISRLTSVTQSPPHFENVRDHTSRVLGWLAAWQRTDSSLPVSSLFAGYANRLEAHFNREITGGLVGWQLLRWAGLWHDAGKFATRTVEEDGRIRFFGHEAESAKLLEAQLRHLKFSNEAIKHISAVVQGHMQPLLLANETAVSKRAMFRFFRRWENAGIDILIHALADYRAIHDNGTGELRQEGVAGWQKLLQMTTNFFAYYFAEQAPDVKSAPLINGNQLMQALNLPPSREVGRLLRLVEEAQAVGDITTPEQAILFAQQAMS